MDFRPHKEMQHCRKNTMVSAATATAAGRTVLLQVLVVVYLTTIQMLYSVRVTAAFVPVCQQTLRNSVISRRSVVSSPSLAEFAKQHNNEERQEEDVVLLDPLVVCGPSGVGKGTIIERYMKSACNNNSTGNNNLPFAFAVSHTTRAPRPGEINGVHYHFTTPKEMERLIAEDAFLEFATVHGNMYGTSWMALQDIHKTKQRALLDIDVKGVQTLKALQKQQPNRIQPKYIFIAPPDLETLQQRLQARGTETPESLQRRTANAAAELEYGLAESGGPPNFDAIVYNHQIEQAVQDFSRAVQELYAKK